MKRYWVAIPIAGSLTISVEAENTKAAIEAAWGKYDDGDWDDSNVEWEAMPSITTGNVCHAPVNNVEIVDEETIEVSVPGRNTGANI